MTQENAIETIRTQANIIDVISSYIPLTLKGKNYFGVCPFHEDHSPSMSVSNEKQIYKCFSCGAAGNVFTFVQEYENITFLEAVKVVADKCGIPYSGTIKKTNPKKHPHEYEIMDLALKFYQNNLNSEAGLKAKAYLKNRSLNEDVIKEFNLGLALDYNYPLYKLLEKKKYNQSSLKELGLINDFNGHITDTFQNRIIFPIHNLEGECIGFTGRIYEESDQAKYINSKESVIFKKGSILFNYHRAKDAIKKSKEVIIVEGNMDAIRMSASGIKNVIALMGTSLTKEQISIIKNLRAKIILMLDNDNAGELATYTIGNILSEANLKPLVVRLSGEKDPDEYIIKNGVEALIDNLKHPLTFLDFKLSYIKKNKDLTKTEDLVSFIKEVIANIKNIDDDLTKEITIKKISEEYDIPYNLLKQELNQESSPKITKKEEKTLAKKALSRYDIAVQNILYYMMNDGIYITKFQKDLGYLDKEIYRSISNEIIYYYEKNTKIDLSSFITYISDKDYIYDEAMSIIKSNNPENLEMSIFTEFLTVANNEMRKNEIKKLKERIKEELDTNKKLELATKLIELKKGCVGNEK